MLSNNSLRLAACTVCVTIFSTGDKFRPVSDSTELHALTLATRSYELLQHRNRFYGVTQATVLKRSWNVAFGFINQFVTG